MGADQLDSLVAVLDLVRFQTARTRPELVQRSGLGRTVVTQRLAQLTSSGLVAEGALGPSTGGRAPRELRFRAEAAVVLVAELGATSISVGLTDLAGQLVMQREEQWDIAVGPEPTLSRVAELFDRMLAAQPDTPPWGIGVGVPGPVEFASGRPAAPPIMPGWDGYPIRDRFAARFNVPVWVDNEVNTMALGEYRAGLGRGADDLIHVKIGTGIGAGLISGGRLHRGTQGCAGDIGHIALVSELIETGPGATQQMCRCGKFGCLEALASGSALARDATAAAEAGRSPALARCLAEAGSLTATDVVHAAEFGDPVAVELLQRAGRLVGETLAALVSFFNPSMVLLGGGVGMSGDLLLATIRQAIYRRSLPLATRDLRIARSQLGDRAGLMGAGFMVVDELFSRALLGRWLYQGTPVGQPTLAAG
ncbi:ROK family protein [Pseudonocardia sp. MH-G8]|uniref:ROK family protein n=1 Tax=Pseudonocardia sp. MH-G8 TaxID=1854588 RepID=UPI000BA18B30|nr:ROK family protein [Pseudonocardia sp. MH-G8]OZM77878.1 sugar kinase [Pseudonocardia sp. MH-G8]